MVRIAQWSDRNPRPEACQWAVRPISRGHAAHLSAGGAATTAVSGIPAVVRVLVIDDEAPIRLLCRLNLEVEGMEVLEAGDGPTGLELARSARPDVVVMDVMMPGLDGWGVAAALLADPATSALPIVFLTARAELRERARTLAIGGVEVLTKPFDPLDLAGVVEEAAAGVTGDAAERRGKLAELKAHVEG